jgi:hypothetical protein
MIDTLAHITTLARSLLILATLFAAALALGTLIDDGGEALRVYRLRGTFTP